MRTHPSRATPWLLLAVLAAFASPARATAQADTTSAVTPHTPRPARVRSDPDRITPADIAAHATARNAYELVRALHPTWLRSRNQLGGPPDSDPLENRGHHTVVLRDGQRLGWVDELRAIQVAAIGEIRYYDAREAVQRWGIGYGGGAIMVITPGSNAQ